MKSKCSKLVQVMIVSVVVIGLLIAAWPGLAQSKWPQPSIGSAPLFEQRAREPQNFARLSSEISIPRSISGSHYDVRPFQSDSDLSVMQWSTIAFARLVDSNTNNFELFTLQDNAVFAQRTFNPAYDSMPRLNRGGSRLAFISNRDGNNEIYTMNLDGSQLSRLTTTSTHEYWPNWSPDGSKIVFYSYRDSNAEIYVMNANGTNQTRLTNNFAWDGHPAWSPDGTQLIFSSDRGGLNDLWVMNANGSNQHQLTFGLDAYYPAWSPDGQQIAFSDDADHDSWLKVAIMNSDGSAKTYLFDGVPSYDFFAPVWAPDGKHLAYAEVVWVLYQGNYYWQSATIYGKDFTDNSDFFVSGAYYDWWPDWQTRDVTLPYSSASSPAWSNNTTFDVQWAGGDMGGSGLKSYDIQSRDGAAGVWTDWITNTTSTSAAFAGQYSHTYYFRSRARDYANNLEAYPSLPDAMTTIYQHTTSSQIRDNRDQPVAVVNVQTDPPALNTGVSRHDGIYDLYFASSGVYTLTTTRSNFGQLPPLLNVTVPSSNSLPTLYLPPLDNQINDSHFEGSDLSAWNLSGASVDLTPTITSTAHTGNFAALLGGSVPTDTINTGPWHSTIEQTINVSPTIVSGTLSLLYRVEAVEPLSDTLDAYLIGANNALTFTLPVTASGWTHAWFDASAWNEPTATVKIDFTVSDVSRTAKIILDEVTWGSAITGSHTAFLPLVRR